MDPMPFELAAQLRAEGALPITGDRAARALSFASAIIAGILIALAAASVGQASTGGGSSMRPPEPFEAPAPIAAPAPISLQAP